MEDYSRDTALQRAVRHEALPTTAKVGGLVALMIGPCWLASLLLGAHAEFMGVLFFGFGAVANVVAGWRVTHRLRRATRRRAARVGELPKA